MAPELLGYLSSDYPLTGPKLCAADLWNLGEITFQLATAKAVFKTQTILTKYTLGRVKFPVSELQHVFASPAMVGFITSAMLVDYQQRPTAAVASAHPWLQGLKTVSAGLPSRAVFNYRYATLGHIPDFLPPNLHPWKDKMNPHARLLPSTTLNQAI